jgi:hypothetical protein
VRQAIINCSYSDDLCSAERRSFIPHLAANALQAFRVGFVESGAVAPAGIEAQAMRAQKIANQMIGFILISASASMITEARSRLKKKRRPEGLAGGVGGMKSRQGRRSHMATFRSLSWATSASST